MAEDERWTNKYGKTVLIYYNVNGNVEVTPEVLSILLVSAGFGRI